MLKIFIFETMFKWRRGKKKKKYVVLLEQPLDTIAQTKTIILAFVARLTKADIKMRRRCWRCTEAAR
jgi:hypothetical protein